MITMEKREITGDRMSLDPEAKSGQSNVLVDEDAERSYGTKA
jgi:hypothetical protein